MNADDRLQLIRVKIERAEKHLDELEAAVLSLGEATFKLSNYPPAEPGALVCEPLEAAGRGR